METFLAERESGVGWSGPVPVRHPELVEDPFRVTFRALLPPVLVLFPPENWVKGRGGFSGGGGGGGGLVEGVPLTGPCGSCACGDWAGVPGLGSDEDVDVDGAPAGLPALSLAESLSGPDLLLFWPSCCACVTFIFLQLGRTRYFRGRGPFRLHV